MYRLLIIQRRSSYGKGKHGVLNSLLVNFRYQLYKGGCKCLLYADSPLETNPTLVKQDIILSCALQTHDKMLPVVDYISEFYLVGSRDQIAGLQTYPDALQLKQPEIAPTFTGVLDNIQISHTVDAGQIDTAILNELNRERCYKMNKSPSDPSIPKLSILERRIRIGVHNGMCYVEEPIYLLLSDTEGGRKRSNSLSRVSRTTKQTDIFQVRNGARLKKLSADERFALVFAVDYLVGVELADGSVSDAQLVMVSWNAWCPYHNGSFTLADTIHVPLTGGSRVRFYNY
jgi:nephrocystin-4